MTSYYPTAVKPLERHRILITFDNNEQRIFDVTPYLDDSFSTFGGKTPHGNLQQERSNSMKRSIVTVGIIGLVAGFIACGNGTTNVSPKTCDCPEITHLEPGQTCPCGADNCKCTLKVNDQLSNSGITIWKEVEVELNDFQQIVEDFKKKL